MITITSIEVSKDSKEKCIHFSDGGVIIEPVDFDEKEYLHSINLSERS